MTSPADKLAAELLADRKHNEAVEKWAKDQARRIAERDAYNERKSGRGQEMTKSGHPRDKHPVELDHKDEDNLHKTREVDGGAVRHKYVPENETDKKAHEIVKYFG
jgi:hypothetical protein